MYVAASQLGGAGVFARRDMAAGELLERGIVRRLPVEFDGHECPHVMTWSEGGGVWAIGSGCATFYNHAERSNTEVFRDFDADRFEIRARVDIRRGEELTQTYRSLGWRRCFAALRESSS